MALKPLAQRTTRMAKERLRRPETSPQVPPDPVVEIASILANGYLRLLARKAAPTASNGPQEPSEIASQGLDDVGKESVHGDG